jgi:Glycosyl hydrolase-like 10
VECGRPRPLRSDVPVRSFSVVNHRRTGRPADADEDVRTPSGAILTKPQTADRRPQTYDVDGVHLDDYFYPYPEKDSSGRDVDFPDDATWQAYRAGGGTLTREAWRRDNINRFVRDLYRTVNTRSRGIVVGMSIYRVGTGRPNSIAAEEIGRQLALIRGNDRAVGFILFSAKTLMQDRGGINAVLSRAMEQRDRNGDPIALTPAAR